jgi:glucose-6-phosphate 1-dehydrogenase
MNGLTCDALVFFGATGDLAYKKIFPSLQAMVKRGVLDVPVIGIAKMRLHGSTGPPSRGTRMSTAS